MKVPSRWGGTVKFLTLSLPGIFVFLTDPNVIIIIKLFCCIPLTQKINDNDGFSNSQIPKTAAEPGDPAYGP